jgi:hypothetical protein
MRTTISLLASTLASLLVTSTAVRADEAVEPGYVPPSEELAVIQAVAGIVTRDSRRAYDFLYFETDFSTSPNVEMSISNPDRTQFCGLTREEARALVNTLSAVSAEPVEFDKELAKSAGLSIGQKKLPRFRYLMLSRVVFAPDKKRAWLAVDQNGETGAVIRLEKVNGEWIKTARCGGWVTAE